jgi:hypothetical protein
MTPPISSATDAVGFVSELAELLLQVESLQSDSATTTRNAARQDFLREAQHQVDALHQAADDVRSGAWAQAALTVAGSACDLTGTVLKFDAERTSSCTTLKDAQLFVGLGKAFASLAAPAKALLGDAPADDANATAKRCETLAEQARWAAGDATTEIDKVTQLGDKVLSTLQGVDQDQSSSNMSLINRI